MITNILAILIQPNQTMRWIAGSIVVFCLLFMMATQLTVFGHVMNVAAKHKPSYSSQQDGLEDPLEVAGVKVINRFTENGEQFTPLYLSYALRHGIVKERYASFSRYMQMQDVLEPGEAMPDPDFLDLYLNSRAHFIAQTECELLLATIASECSVSHVKARQTNKLAQFSGNLYFVPKATARELDKTKTWRFETNSAVLDKKARPVSFSRVHSRRKAAYDKMVENCEKLRHRVGDCTIVRAEVEEGLSRNKDKPYVRSKVVYGYLRAMD